MTARWHRQRRHLLLTIILIAALYLFSGGLLASTESRWLISSDGDLTPQDKRATADPGGESPKHTNDDVEIVVASMKRENITWLHNYLLSWTKNIYVVDDRNAELTVPQNKGRESMVFLT